MIHYYGEIWNHPVSPFFPLRSNTMKSIKLFILTIITFFTISAYATDYTAAVNFAWTSNNCKSELGDAVGFEAYKIENNRIAIRQLLSTRTQQYGMPGSYTIIPVPVNFVQCKRIAFQNAKPFPGSPGWSYNDAGYQCTGVTPFLIIKVGRTVQGTANGFRSECKVIRM